MECLTGIRDGHGTVINCTRGSSCFLILRFVSLMYSCPFRRCQFSDLLSLHRWTNSHGSWEYRQGIFCFAKHAWKRSFVGGATRSCLGALGFHGSPSTYLIFFALRTRLRFSSSAGRWRYKWDMLDNKFVERNATWYVFHSHSFFFFETSILRSLQKKPYMLYKIF